MTSSEKVIIKDNDSNVDIGITSFRKVSQTTHMQLCQHEYNNILQNPQPVKGCFFHVEKE